MILNYISFHSTYPSMRSFILCLCILATLCQPSSLHAQGCVNDQQSPPMVVMIQPTTATQIIQPCQNLNEFSRLTGIHPGITYEFAITDNAYITVREGSYNGPLLGEGYGTVQVTPTSIAHLFVHFNVDDACSMDWGCYQSTVTPLSEATPTVVDCSVPLVETYCYTDNDLQTWTYTGGGVMRLRFLQGTIEMGLFDELYIYDGTDTDGDILFQHNSVNGNATCNLGPEGSGSDPNNNCYYEVDVFAPSGSVHMVILTDFSISCSGISLDPFIWEVSCGSTVTGKIFLDSDLDCQFDTTEYALPQMIVEVQPGPFYATTNSTGDFYMVLDEGTYTIQQLSPAVIDHCNSSPQTFQVQPDGSSPLLLFPDTAATGLDLQVMMSSGAARLGFQHSQAITVKNVSANIAGQANFELTYDPVLIFGSADPEPASITGNTLVWDIAPVGPFEELTFQIT